MTLAGMIVCVMSAALYWTRQAAPPSSSAIAAFYINQRAHAVNGYDLTMGPISVGWIVVLCAVLCGLLLLVQPADGKMMQFRSLQVGLSLVILSLAVLHMGLFAGVIAALAGGVLLLCGAILRYR